MGVSSLNYVRLLFCKILGWYLVGLVLYELPFLVNSLNTYVPIEMVLLTVVCRFLAAAVDSSKRSPELIQLLDMHTHFASGTPGTRVCLRYVTFDLSLEPGS